MNKVLTRKQSEKIWNVLNEINDRILDIDDLMEIPLLGGWVRNKYNEGVRGVELNDLFTGRIWAFRYIENRGVIKKLKVPRGKKLDNYFKFEVDKKRLEKYYKSVKKSHGTKVKIYESSKATGEQIPSDKNNAGTYKSENGVGYLIIEKREIKMGQSNGRKFKFIRCLWHPDRFGCSIAVDAVFEEISIERDKKNKSLFSDINSKSEKIKIIRGTIKEIQRILKSEGLDNYYQFSTKENACRVSLKK